MSKRITVYQNRTSSVVKGKLLDIVVPNEIPAEVDADGKKIASVIMITGGGKFFITKTSSILWLCKELKAYYSDFVDEEVINDTKMFYPLALHLWSNDVEKVKIDILFSSSNGYEVMKYELEQLLLFRGDKLFLNKNKTPIVPKFKTVNSPKKWLNQNEYLNFMKLLKKYDD